MPGEEPLPEEEEGEVADDGEEWLKKVEEEEDFEVRQLTLVEIVKSRASANLMEAVARMVTKLRYYGLPVKRLHSDRAGEFTAKRARQWALDRGILRTFTDGSSWKMNGRAEAEVGFMKRLTNTLLKGTGVEEKLWPLAARHAGERRWRTQVKAWNNRTKDWQVYRKQVTRHLNDGFLGGVLCPGGGRKVLPHGGRGDGRGPTGGGRSCGCGGRGSG